jgi:hypothetical protein
MKQAESPTVSALGYSIGRSTAISTSKIIKIPAIRKNSNEHDSHTEDFGSNPHSR